MKNPHCDKDALGSSLQRGFSLLELLIASTVAAAAGAMLVSGLVAANRSAKLRIEGAIVTQLLASQLALLDMELDEQTPTSGTSPSPLGNVTWSLTWAVTALPSLAEATLTITQNGHHAHVVTYRQLAQP